MNKLFLKIFSAIVFIAVSLFTSGIMQLQPAFAMVGNGSCPSTLKSGDMVKVAGKAAIYLISKDSKLLYFPDGDVFKSWHSNYGGYLPITQNCLDSIPVPNTYPVGVNFKPGSYIVKKASSSQLYAIPSEDTLAKISASTATALYGSYKVMTVKDIFWPNYMYRAADITQPDSSNSSNSSSDSSGSGSSSGTSDTSPAIPTSPVTTVTVPASGNTYYVATTGKDSNSGTSASPWASPAYGASQLKPGDTLIIMGGKYTLTDYGTDMINVPSGVTTNYVVIKGQDGNRPILAGGNNLFAAINLSNTSYAKISNLEITNNGTNFRDAINGTDGPVNNVVLENLYIHNVDEYGINIGDTDGLKIVNSVISYTGFGAIGGPAGTSGGWKNALITGTTMSYGGHYYQGGSGPSPYDRPDGFGIEASAGPIEIAYSLSEHNKGDGIDSKAENTYVHDTIIRNNSSDGLKLWGTNSKAVNVSIYGRGDGVQTPWASIVLQSDHGNPTFTLDHVTVDEPQNTCYIMHVQYDYQNIPTNLNITNSIFNSRGGHCPIFLAPSVTAKISSTDFNFPGSDNVFEYGNTTYDSTQVNQFGTGNIYADPKFVSPAWGTVGNYNLQSGSPAGGKGYSGG